MIKHVGIVVVRKLPVEGQQRGMLKGILRTQTPPMSNKRAFGRYAMLGRIELDVDTCASCSRRHYRDRDHPKHF